jgi:ATP-dependent Clp protease adaptor protein ClpS
MGDGLPTTIAVALPLALALGAAGRRAYVSHARRRLLRFSSVEMRVLAGVAARAAALRHEPHLLPEHLLLAATLAEPVGDALAAQGIDAAALRAALAWEMADVDPDEEDDPGRWLAPSAASAAALLAAEARARAVGRELAPIDVVPALLETAAGSWAGRVLAAFGVDAGFGPAAVDRDHGPEERAAPPYRRGELPGAAAVVLHDDGAQRLPRVARLLRECFGKDEAEADHIVLTASHAGSARVGVYSLDDVTRLVDEATAAAAASDLSLRLTVVAAVAPRRARAGLRLAATATEAIANARYQAREARHREVSVGHLLHALLGDEALAARVGAAGGDAPALVSALEDHFTRAIAYFGVPAPSADLDAALTRALAAARASGQPSLDDTDLLVAVLEAGGPPWLRTLLAAQGLTPEGVRRVAVPDDEAGAPGTRVVFHNDDRTTMAMVVAILVDVFGKSDTAARAVMLRVHHDGSAVVGAYAPEVAEAKLAEALAIAREGGAPLQITLEASPPAP